MQPSEVWIAFGLLVVAVLAALGGMTRYVITVLRDVDKRLDDKVSIGEYNRRHEDLERMIRGNYEQRLRAVERWQDQLNGRIRGKRSNDQYPPEKC